MTILNLAIYGAMLFFGALVWFAGEMWTTARQGKRPNNTKGVDDDK